jgi:hypothetical protein
MDAGVKTVSELIDLCNGLGDATADTKDTAHIYTVSGIAFSTVDNTFGNFTMWSEDFTKSIKVYGSTVTASALVRDYTAATPSVTFTNPKDFVYGTTFKDGDLLTMQVVAENYKGTPEIMGVITARDTRLNRATYTASVTAPVNGTVKLSKTEGIYIGEQIEVVATPAEGYKLDAIKANGKTLTADTKGKYYFTAFNVNTVEATFVSESAVVSSLELTVTSLNLASSAYGNGTGTIGGVAFSATATGNYGDGIQMRANSAGNSTIANTAATPTGIKNIVFTYTAGKTPAAKTDILDISFGTDNTYAVETLHLSTDAATTTYTITPTAATNTFVKIAHASTPTGTLYFSSIVINLATA